LRTKSKSESNLVESKTEDKEKVKESKPSPKSEIYDPAFPNDLDSPGEAETSKSP
jgi:hypothetical protein